MSFPQNICFAKSLSHFFIEMKIYSNITKYSLNSQIKIELLAWKNQNLSIIWLKPTKHGKSGYYISDEDERNNIDDALFNNIINKDEWAELMNTFI